MGFEVVAVGTSFGGLDALEVLLKDLPPHFPLAVVVVTHRINTSSSQLSQALQAYSRLPIIEPEDRELILPGRVYLAPADYHLLIEAGEKANHFTFSTEAPVCYARPSIDVLFESAADVYGQNLIGIILTGANFDGAAGLAKIKAQGGLTVVQEPKTAFCSIMPMAAIASTKVDEILPLEKIADFVISVCQQS